MASWAWEWQRQPPPSSTKVRTSHDWTAGPRDGPSVDALLMIGVGNAPGAQIQRVAEDVLLPRPGWAEKRRGPAARLPFRRPASPPPAMVTSGGEANVRGEGWTGWAGWAR